MAIQVNTASVLSSAEQIDRLNRRIHTDLDIVNSEMLQLQQNWQGEAATFGIGQYEHIKNSYEDARFDVVDEMVCFMKKVVGANYNTTEKKVSKAASAFR